MANVLAQNVQTLRRSLGLSQVGFADKLGVQQSYISKWEAGRVEPAGSSIAAMAALAQCGFEEFRTVALAQSSNADGQSLEAHHRRERSDHTQTRSIGAGETAPVTRLDLSYSMGPGTDIDSAYVDGEQFEFDIGFLRTMTITPPERIRIVDGIGDSMQPTIHDRDLLFIDINQATLNAQDRIWAIWLFGLGAVKRLRAIDDDKVMVISDNPDVDNQVVKRSDVIIHGRVVGSIKRH